MSEAVAGAIEALKEKLDGTDIEETVKFDIEDEGTILVQNGEVAAGDGDAEVTISASLDTFREIFDGELSPTAAYMSGRMAIEGDMGVAMKLSQVLG
ncbi:MAG: SCP2 sterol-binding domain-containing protein [Paracoccaceae bacterium]|nr:SCP2 sterol-binding domain-containing protein [Paracoccaceae bacterium]